MFAKTASWRLKFKRNFSDVMFHVTPYVSPQTTFFRDLREQEESITSFSIIPVLYYSKGESSRFFCLLGADAKHRRVLRTLPRGSGIAYSTNEKPNEHFRLD